ncbi:hypothetical protein EV356DRAFT_533651 [Viridothelium virens]|uniref:PH domain-containing protein n=1 Tax=Viridothelium virens TaxID=1048519 RepID=A0A6A6H6L1_VIRVR|nr:hypothetical protein EV356DRAFT_533651 [Viridothelium virens]
MARDKDVYISSFGRRSPRDLPPIRTSFSSSTPSSKGNVSRSGNPLVDQTPRQPRPSAPAPAPTPKMDRRQSKMSLFNLFSRPKVERSRGYTEGGMPATNIHPVSETQHKMPPKYTSPQFIDMPVPPKAISTLIGPPRQVQQVPPRESSRRALSHRESRSNLARQPSSPEFPPLFQAFPNSIKHASLPALNYSADSILRAQNSKRSSLIQNFRDSKIDLTAEDAEAAYSRLSSDKSSRRFSSQSLASSGWTRKFFLLLPSGLLLQYPGNGTPEREPEKVLQLEKDSAAFASDAIPGRHWVLQVSQNTKSEGSGVPTKSRSLLSRFKIQGGASRKTTGNMLLVMESAEDLNSWMMAIRNEIDIIGGKKGRPDAHPAQTVEESLTEHDFYENQSLQTTVRPKMTTMMSPIPDTPSSPVILTSEWDKNETEAETRGLDAEVIQPSTVDSASKSLRHSMQRPPSDRASTATFLSSGEQQLNQLRNSSRESNMSTNTFTTSRASSPESQDSHLPKHMEQESRRSPIASKGTHTSPTMSSSSWRRSMQTLPRTDEYSVFPKDSAPRGKRVSMRPYSNALPVELSSSVLTGSPTRLRQSSLPNTQPKAVPESAVLNFRQGDVSPTDANRTVRPVRSSPKLKRSSTTPEVPELPEMDSSEQTTPKPSLIRPLHCVSALNQESSRRASEPKQPRRNSAVPMRLPIRPSLPALDTSTSSKPVGPASRSTFLNSATPTHSPPLMVAPGVTARPLASAPKQPEPTSLKRPTSVQVRANPAPFLSTVRSTRTSVSESPTSSSASPSDQPQQQSQTQAPPPYNPRTSSLGAPVSLNDAAKINNSNNNSALAKPHLAGARSFSELAATNRASSASSILAPPPRSTGARYFSESGGAARFRVRITPAGQQGLQAQGRQQGQGLASGLGLASRRSMPYLQRDSGIGLPPPRAPPPEVPLPRVPTQVVS